MGVKVFQRCDPKLLRRTALGSALPPNMIGHAIPPLEIQSTTLANALWHTVRKMWTKLKCHIRWSEPAGCQTEKGLKCQILHDLFSDERDLYVHSYNNVSAFVNKLNQTPSGGISRNWKLRSRGAVALRAYPIFSLWNIITRKKVFVIQNKSIFNNDCIKTHCTLHSAAKIISPQEFKTEKNVIKQKVQH